MRQRVKAYWDEQRHFMIPDHGSASWLARSFSNWLWGFPSLGSAFHDSIFLTVMHDFSNLRKLVIGYEEPRTYPLVRTVAEDLSIGLGRYLAGSGGAQLEVLKLEQVWPSDLEILTSILRNFQSQPELCSPPSKPSYSIPGSWPVTPPTPPSLPSSSTPPQRRLRLQRLHVIFIGNGEASNISRTSHLANLLAYTPILISLDLRGSGPYPFSTSLVNFRAPPLPRLETIGIKNFVIDAEAIVSLTAQHNESLQRISLADLYLIRGTWTEVARLSRQDRGRWETGITGLGYLGQVGGIRHMTVEDEQAWTGGE